MIETYTNVTTSTITWPDFRRRLEAEGLIENGPKSRSMARYALNELEELLDPISPACLTTERIEDYERQLRGRGNADMTVRRKLRVLRVALNFAASIGAIDAAPVMRLPRELSRYRPRGTIAAADLPEPIVDTSAWGDFNRLYQREASQLLSYVNLKKSRELFAQIALLLAPETVEEVAGRQDEFTAGLKRLGNSDRTIANKLSRLRMILAWHADAEPGSGFVKYRLTPPRPPRRPAETPWQLFRARYEREHVASLGTRSRQDNQQTFDEVERLLAPIGPEDLTAGRLSELQALLRESQIAVATIRKKLSIIRAALNWAARMKIIAEAPEIRLPRRTGARLMKGRPLSDAEFARMLAATVEIVGLERAPSFRHLVRGLWCSGLRLAEATNLKWDGDEGVTVDMDGRRPLLRIVAEKNKAGTDQLIPLAPEFAELLAETPEDRRTGFVFNPRQEAADGARYRVDDVGKIISKIGEAAAIAVGKRRNGKSKFASAHDLRRTFITRWSKKVKPVVLQQIARHCDIHTTMSYYVNNDAEDLADILWQNRGTEPAAKPALATAYEERPIGDNASAASR